MTTPLAVFLHDDRYDRVYQALNLVLTASSMGRPSHLFLFFGALAAFIDGTWEDPRSMTRASQAAPSWSKGLERRFALHDGPSFDEMLEMAKKEAGGLTVCACSTSVRMLELEPAKVKERVDHIMGLSAMLDIASSGNATVLYI